MTHPEIDTKQLLYSSLQYRHHKNIRNKYNIKSPQIQVLTALYYITILFKPPKMGIKSNLYQLIPHVRRVFLHRSLRKLDAAGLIEFDEGDNNYNYSIELTSAGREVIESLYSVGNVEMFLNSSVKGLNL